MKYPHAPRLTFILFSLLLVILAANPVRAEIGEVLVTIHYPGGSPAAGVVLELLDDSTSTIVASGTTNSSGEFSAFSVPESASYVVKIFPRESLTLIDGGKYLDSSEPVTISSLSSNYDSISDKLSLTPILLSPAPRFFRLQLTNSGAALNLSSVTVNAFDNERFEESFATTSTNGQGVAFIPIPDTKESIWTFNITSESTSDHYFEVTAPSGGAIVQLSQEVSLANSVLTINFQDSNGTTFTVPTDPDLDRFVECSKEGSIVSEFKDLVGGETSIVMNVPSGSYECRVEIEGYGSSEVEVELSESGSASLSLILVQKDATITVQIIDSITGQAITGFPIGVFGEPAESGVPGAPHYEDYLYEETTTGQADFTALSDVSYEFAVDRVSSETDKTELRVITTQGGDSYVLPQGSLAITPKPGTSNVLQFQAIKTTSFITVSAFSPNGAPLSQGFVDAFVPLNLEASLEENDESFFSGVSLSDGMATIPVIAGKEYEVRVIPTYTSNATENFIPPPVQRVTLKEGETKNLEFRLEEPNYQLALTATLMKGGNVQSAVPEHLSCGAYNEQNQESYFELESGGVSGTLPLLVSTPPRKWNVYCQAVVEEGETDTLYFGESTFLPKKNSASGELSITLEEDTGLFGPSEYLFDATKAAFFLLPDEKGSITIPALAVANSGTVKMTVTSGRGYTFSKAEFPVTTYDISFEVAGALVTTTQKPISIRFSVTAEELQQLGVTEGDTKGGAFDTNTRLWKEDATYSYDSVTETLLVSAKHFSLWGVLIDKSNAQKRVAPTKLKVRRIKKGKGNRLKVTWKGPVSNLDEVFELEVARVSKKKKRGVRIRATDWTKAKVYEVVGEKKRIRLRKSGRYAARVRLVGGVNSQVKRALVK